MAYVFRSIVIDEIKRFFGEQLHFDCDVFENARQYQIDLDVNDSGINDTNKHDIKMMKKKLELRLLEMGYKMNNAEKNVYYNLASKWRSRNLVHRVAKTNLPRDTTVFQNKSHDPYEFNTDVWSIIKDFIGLYNIKMDYHKIKSKVKKKDIIDAYFGVAKQPLFRMEIILNRWGEPEKLPKCPNGKMWVDLVLKRAALGYKNKEFYEELSRLIEHSAPKMQTCICGKIVSKTNYTHIHSKSHVNFILENIAVSDLETMDKVHLNMCGFYTTPFYSQATMSVIRIWNCYARRPRENPRNIVPFMKREPQDVQNNTYDTIYPTSL